MRDVTAGRSAGAPYNDELDPTRAYNDELDPTRAAGEPAGAVVGDVTAGRSAGTAWNTAQDPTRPVSIGDPRR